MKLNLKYERGDNMKAGALDVQPERMMYCDVCKNNTGGCTMHNMSLSLEEVKALKATWKHNNVTEDCMFFKGFRSRIDTHIRPKKK